MPCKLRKICCLCKKKKTHTNGSFFGVPFDERKRKIWSEVCKMQFYKYAYVCEDHFLSSDIIRGSKNNLMPSAVPFVLPLLEHPMPDSHAGASSTSVHNMCSQDVLDISMEAPIEEPEEPMEPYEPMEYIDAQTQTDITILESKLQKQNQEYRSVIKNLQEENEVLRRKFAKTNAVVTFMRSIFTEGQMRKVMSHRKIRWNRNDISNAIRLHASGPKAYNYLYKKGFPLPQVSELEHYCRKVNVNEKFLTSSLGFIKHCTELTNEDKICVLSFVDTKVVETNGKVKYVQVVMARGLWKSWKRPIFCDFDCQIKEDILCSIITNLSQAGFQVVAMVCDMTSSNRKLWKDLGVTKEKPWFPNPVSPEDKLFTFADAPHLLELIRYSYLDTGLMFNNKLLTARTIANLMEYTTNSDKSIELKLTEEHLSMEGVGGKRLAAQLFSNTTSNAIRQCESMGVNLNKSTETAELIKLLNDWFDVLNSNINTFSSPGKEPFGIALVDQQSILMRMNQLMSSPIIPNKTSMEYFQEGVIMTNNALEMLYDYIKQKFNMTYILTNQLNQDVLKHVLGAIQSKGGSGGDHPTPNEFKFRLRKYILAQNMEHLHATESMESDITDWLSSTDTLAVRKYIDKQKVTDEFAANREHEVLHEIVADRDPEVLDELDTENFDEVDVIEEGDLAEYITAYTASD